MDIYTYHVVGPVVIAGLIDGEPAVKVRLGDGPEVTLQGDLDLLAAALATAVSKFETAPAPSGSFRAL